MHVTMSDEEVDIMPGSTIADAVSSGRVLISDGAWGTAIFEQGCPPDDCLESWALTHVEALRQLAAGYLAAGADMVKTDTFGANRFHLAHFGLQDQVARINEAAAGASRVAAGDDHWVIASVGPSGMMLCTQEVTPDELSQAFREQVVGLAAGGADAICIETMSDPEEAALAIQAAKDNTGLEVIATFSFAKTVRGDFRTMMGADPAEAVAAAVAADIVGANCGDGIADMVELVRQMRGLTAKPIVVHANAGLPHTAGGRTTFPDSPADMARWVPDLIAAGAGIVGGCCGTTPAHIAAMRAAVR